MDARDFNPELYGEKTAIVIFGTADMTEAIIVKGMLEANGLNVLENAPSAGGHTGYIELSVPSDEAAIARELLALYEGESPDLEEPE